MGGIRPLNDKPYIKELMLEWSENTNNKSSNFERVEEILEDFSPSPSVEVIYVSFYCGLKFPL